MVGLIYYLRNYESSKYEFILSANVKGMSEHYREIFQSISRFISSRIRSELLQPKSQSGI